jgi:hypothetical protein
MVTTASILMQTQQSYDRRHDGLYTDANTNSIRSRSTTASILM